jgi:hypothetical protein
VPQAVEIKEFTEDVEAGKFPALVSKNVCMKTDKDVAPVLREIVKLSKTEGVGIR